MSPGAAKQIYTDWANHYLEKARRKRFITDLQTDICDGVLLAEVIEAVTNEKVPDITTKPRTAQQMIDNITACLTFLSGIGVNIEGLNAKDIKDGNLKGILGLFFSLSRYKQQQKSTQQHQLNQNVTGSGSPQTGSPTSPTSPSGNVNTGLNATSPTAANNTSASRRGSTTNGNTEMLSRLPGLKGSSKCPTVTNPSLHASEGSSSGTLGRTSSLARHKPGVSQSADRSLTRQNNNSTSGLSLKSSSRESCASRSTSPSSVSGIPTPGVGRGSNTGVARSYTSTSAERASGSRLPNSTSTSSCASSASSTKSASNTNSATKSSVAAGSATARNNNSMLDKFKFFKDKDKSGKSGSSKGSSKSSKKEDAKSKAGDSAASTSGGQKTSPDGGASKVAASSETGASGGSNSPKSAQKAAAKKSISSKSVVKKEAPASRDEPNTGTGRRGLPQPGVGAQGTSRASSSTSIASSASSVAGNRKSLTGKSSGEGGSGAVSPSGTGKSSPVTAKKSSSKIASLNATKTATSSKSGRSSLGQQPQMSGHASTGQQVPTPTPSTSLPKPASIRKIPSDTKGGRASSGRGMSNSTSGTALSKLSAAPSSSLSVASSVERCRTPTGVSKSLDTASSGNHTTMSLPKFSDGESMQQARSQRSGHLPDRRNQSSSSSSQHDSMPGRSARGYASMERPMVGAPGVVRMGAQMSAKMDSRLQANKMQYGHEPKPGKVDSDTQTPVSAVRVTAAREAAAAALNAHHSSANQYKGQENHVPQVSKPPGKEVSNQSISSTESVNISTGSAGADSNTSSSNSAKHSNSSNDSVIFRPSSCDEVESSGVESDSGVRKPPVDHISSLRKNHQNAQRTASPHSGGSAPCTPTKGPRKETTFERDVRTETRHAGAQRETAIIDDVEETIDIKPMQPIMRSTPYAYLRPLHGQSPLARPSFHIPTFSVHNLNSASSRLGVNRPLIDPTKLLSNAMKRTVSNFHSVESDYGSDAEGFDIGGGYMSDGDYLRNPANDDLSSGYLSEGGASLYAKRMQQRFREGMEAVKECMQKSSGLIDNDDFDDNSSISSGEISDTINEISTDEALSGASLSGTSSERTNPYSSIKRSQGSHSSIVPSGIPGKSGGLLYPKSNPALGKTVTDADSGSWGYGAGEDPSFDVTSLGSQSHLKYSAGNYRMVEIPSALAKKKKVPTATLR